MTIKGTIITLGTALLLLAFTPAAGGQEDGGMSWSADDCAACHTEQVESFSRNPHSVLDDREELRMDGHGSSCTGCHGDASRHMEEGGGAGTIFNFGEDSLASTRIDACLTCHADAHPRFKASPHARAGLDCTSCHGIHSDTAADPPMLKAAHSGNDWPSQSLSEASATCYECHAEVFTQFEFNERHRLQEGILDCTSCHNPHGPSNRTALGGFKHQACIECHTDKGGPWVFEHGSQRVEGCVACHSPHGSPNRHMLAFQNVAELCYSCHVAVPGFHARFTLETQCTSCHSTIHGSNFDPAFLR